VLCVENEAHWIMCSHHARQHSPNVLRELANTFEKEQKSKRKGQKTGPTFICFVKEDHFPTTDQENTRTGIMNLADEWMMEVDLNGRMI